MSGTRSFVDSLKLPEVVAAFHEGRATADDVARVYYSDRDTMYIALGACNKANVSDAVEDIHQEICIRTIAMLNKSEITRNIYGFIKIAARNACIDLVRRRASRKENSLEEIIDKFGDSTHLIITDSSNIISRPDESTISRQKDMTQAVFNEKMHKHFNRYEFVFGGANLVDSMKYEALANEPLPLVKVKPKRTPRTTPKVRSDDIKVLLELRRLKGQTNEGLAALLSIKKDTLCFYIYSDDRPVPESVMEEARKLMGELPSSTFDEAKYLEDTPIKDIVEKWMKDLDVDPADPAANDKLGKLLGVARSTVWRWRTGRLIPTLTVRAAKNQRVQEYLDAA